MVILHWILGWSKLPTRVKGVWLGWGQLCCVTVTEETLLFVLSGCCFGVWSPGSSACGLEFTLRETCLVLISDSFGSVHEYHETETGQRKFDNRKECATLVASWIKRFVNFCKNFRVWKKKNNKKSFWPERQKYSEMSYTRSSETMIRSQKRMRTETLGKQRGNVPAQLVTKGSCQKSCAPLINHVLRVDRW